MTTILLIILGFLLVALGVAGCVFPVLPGPALAFAALVVLCFAKGWGLFSLTFWVVMLLLLLFVTIADYIIPMLGAQRSGASKRAMLAGTVGMIAGLLFFPPFGVFIGAFAGAVIGELLEGADRNKAFSVGWGVFVGSLASIGLQLAYCLLILFYYIKAAFF